ncbi:hypothetical protein [Erythrobacter sp. JK5]|uniref:hypothetical protein n=1 Tax=Erythrobacter sp. JK5 TaxID=2829500 RepID=UPI001BAC3C7A|nr:hypothetical protein [Erythrobacter sp. JK5]QUL37331.1 hypothetical protein KDC96_13325 [Erythrobacter sp. JK5]
MATAYLRDTVGFLRWRLVPVRMLGKLKSVLAGPAPTPEAALTLDRGRAQAVERDGYTMAAPVDPDAVAQIREIYLPRGEQVVPREGGHPFENIMRAEDFTADNPVFRLAFSDAILGAAEAYFGGRFLFDSMQVLHSFPTEGELRASQFWHRDYGDSKSLHFVMYVNDVLDDEGGPFVFIDKATSRTVKRSPFIRRLTDAQIAAEIGHDRFETFYGKSGEAVLVDPAVCYHFGSRCKTPRTAVFITFNTNTPIPG